MESKIASSSVISLKAIHESPTNPRKSFGDIDGLAEEIKRHGLLQPVMLRPHPKKTDEFELVFGARRFRAAKLAGLKAIDANIRSMSDAEVLEVQIVENAKRLDIHPLEEADAYQALHKAHGYSAEDISLKVGKSLSSVYQRLKLVELCEPARKSFLDGKILPGVAQMIARIPGETLQKEALKKVTETMWNGELMGHRAAADYIGGRFMLQLAKAPFDKADKTLVPSAGACTVCPKRTGNQKELFSDVKSADTCTDPSCFSGKKDAAWNRIVAKHPSHIIGAKESKPLFFGDHILQSAPYIDLADKNYDDDKSRTWAECLAGKGLLKVSFARDDEGNPHELVQRADVAAVFKAHGKKLPFGFMPEAKEESPAKSKTDRAKAATKKAARPLMMTDLAEHAETATNKSFWLVLARGAIRSSSHDACAEVVKRRALTIVKGKRPVDALFTLTKTLSGARLQGLVVELLASRDEETFKELCALFKLIAAQYEKKVAKAK